MYNTDSRVKSSVKNTAFSAFGQIINELLSFIVRTVFIRTLEVEYLGVNGLFTNILSFLSLAELGVGSALVFSMYKPIAEHDEEKLQVYMELYKKVYRVIGIVVISVGIMLTPFLDFFIKERPDIPHLEWIYILFVLNTAATYFFAYKGSIFNADQRTYVVTNNTTIFRIIQAVFRIAILLITKDFIAYLVVSIVIVYIQNITISKKADAQYPFLKRKTDKKLSKEELKTLKKNIGALMMHRVGNVILNSSDNLIISKFVGLISVGLYSNYSLITNAIKTAFDMVMNSITPSVGNLCAKESEDKVYSVHNSILMLNVWLVSFCAICFIELLNPFVNLWLGSDYLLRQSTVIALSVSFYIQCAMRTNEMFKTGSGLFWNDRYAPIAQCIINVVVSIIFAVKFEITGIFIGTSVAMLSTKFWVGPYVLYKYKFKKSVAHYFARFGIYTTIGIAAAFITHYINTLIPASGIIPFAFKMVVCAVIPNLIFLITLRHTDEFGYCFHLVFRRKANKQV